jgi:hypothetical protein
MYDFALAASLILMSTASSNPALAMIVPTAPDADVARTTVAHPATAAPAAARNAMYFVLGFLLSG